ncbi:MAG: hypothetical protein CMH70_08085 [Nitrosomonadaceae bacterium]|mgnify:CR=1 FL=1|nr:hypothetical protein [Nitrosomonadaceae bacterium]|tara:strand:+ start:1206 stop:1427 length:222 start_codon:yes stop_codon:yes gene_type:complete
MKLLFFLLIIVNLALVSYIQLGTSSDEEKRLRPEFKPEKIRLLSKATDCLESGDQSCFGQKEELMSNTKVGLK